MPHTSYQRIMVKLSGETLGRTGCGVELKKLALVVSELKALRARGVRAAVVVGGGNVWRKREQGRGLDGVTADYLGMVATVMNALALRQALAKAKVPCVVQSAVAFDLPYVERVDILAARGALRRGEIVIFAGGTGRPYVTTDTAAARHAAAIQAEVIVKVGPVDGVYSADPRVKRSAKRYSVLTAREAIARRLKVMDKEAFEFARSKRIPIIVCQWKKGALQRVAQGRKAGTLVRPE